MEWFFLSVARRSEPRKRNENHFLGKEDIVSVEETFPPLVAD